MIIGLNCDDVTFDADDEIAHSLTVLGSWNHVGADVRRLADVDAGRELRRYSVLQLWILVPLSLVAVAVTACGGEGQDMTVC